ncbi:hypothetical protein SADUNF_Sadunf02G0051200 [Salix dunnii]|uniref:RRM domain-containing protein n=1 Tax=Salix dunnii TaxID=1413687 RepID=A0A835N6F0_9ROSI|nr:hypothetical protein SADUNF_Sadunf02G0051200 [Salix dunnii]
MKVTTDSFLGADDKAWPPGFRFHPTDEELVVYYLKRKICKKRLKLNIIREVDVYKWDPEELPEELKRCPNVQDYYALYKVYKKSGAGPKNGEQYGAPFKEEDWADDEFPRVNGLVTPEIPVKQHNEATLVDNFKLSTPHEPPLNDFEEIINQIGGEHTFNELQNNDITCLLPQDTIAMVVTGEEEAQSTLVDPCFREFVCEPVGELTTSDQHCNKHTNFNFDQSDTSTLQLHEAPEVTSATNYEQAPQLNEGDFLEINDLIDPEPSFSNAEQPVENLQFDDFDGLSEFDLFHDAAMFLRDLGPVDQEAVSHSYMHPYGCDMVNQVGYQSQPDSFINAVDNHLQRSNLVANQVDCDLQPQFFDAEQMNSHLWMHDHGQRSNMSAASESHNGIFFQSPPGAVSESSNNSTRANENQVVKEGDAAANGWFSSALWGFVESIPTTPASASENPLVNKALERMSSFSRIRMNVKSINVDAASRIRMNVSSINVAAANGAASVRSAGRTKGFVLLSIVGVLCAILWVLLGSVGNIPYDATEEQLIEICREVGPVVSFRLVIDRETGKPKGYGFCEYKDEETALSARRNLQGYEINGRQLRVDFAENDKNADRNREQGRGGPRLAANNDPQKQIGGPAILEEPAQHQPIGLHIAITAATVMAGALGGAQTVMQSNQNGLQSQTALASDPLTLHLAKMSRNQLNEIMSQLKGMATQNREAAHQLLLGKPQLSKALFQAQIMLGMVTPQVLQLPNIRQSTVQPALSSLQDSQQVQRPTVSNLPGFTPTAPRMQLGLGQFSAGPQPSVQPQKSLVHNQFSATLQPTVQAQTQIPQHVNNHVPHHATLLGQSAPLPSTLPSVRPPVQMANSTPLNQQMQPSLVQHTGQVGNTSARHNPQMVLPNKAMQSSLLSRPPATGSFQSGLPVSSGVSDAANADRPTLRSNAYLNMQTSAAHDSKEPINRPSKVLKLDDGRSMSVPMRGSNSFSATGSGPSQTPSASSVPPNPLPRPEELQHSGKQVPQLPADIESALLQQVMNLTPEQLSSLPPDQQQQVIQLQQALRRDQMQPS